jgi:hypothetical protein
LTALDALGFLATAVFAASYFCKRPSALRRTQATAALLWIAYGVALKAAPIIVANLVVASLAIWSSRTGSREEPVERRGASAGPAHAS